LPFFAHYGLERYHVVKRQGDLSILPVPQATSPRFAITEAVPS
jgi:hypothetical protein